MDFALLFLRILVMLVFVSSGWSDPDAVQAWRSTSERGERLGRWRALCDEFQAGDYVLSALVG